jgi:hypothetical protein
MVVERVVSLSPVPRLSKVIAWCFAVSAGNSGYHMRLE